MANVVWKYHNKGSETEIIVITSFILRKCLSAGWTYTLKKGRNIITQNSELKIFNSIFIIYSKKAYIKFSKKQQQKVAMRV